MKCFKETIPTAAVLQAGMDAAGLQSLWGSIVTLIAHGKIQLPKKDGAMGWQWATRNWLWIIYIWIWTEQLE